MAGLFIHRKAISPIVAVLLMILVAIAAGVMVYSFISGWIGGATTSTSSVGNSILSVDYVYADATNDQLTLSIRNIGSGAAYLDKIYIKSDSGSYVYPSNIYQRIITITENTGSNLTNYQVKIVLDSSNFDFTKANSDGSDVRFYDMNNNPLPYYIEVWDSTARLAIIWVKLNLTGGGTTRIKMVYNNPSLTVSTSNPYSVFDFYDDFSGSSLNSSIWGVSTGAVVSLSGGRVLIQRGSIYTLNPILSSPQEHVFEVKLKYNNFQSYSGLMIADSQGTYGSNVGGNALSYIMNNPSSALIYVWAADGVGGGYDYTNSIYSSTINVDYILGFSYVDASSVNFFVKDANNNVLASRTWMGTWNKNVYLFLGYFTGSNADGADCSDISVDWVRVRKYVTPEPTVSIGAEELYEIGVLQPGSVIILNISVPIDQGVVYQVIIVTQDGSRTTISVRGK